MWQGLLCDGVLCKIFLVLHCCTVDFPAIHINDSALYILTQDYHSSSCSCGSVCGYKGSVIGGTSEEEGVKFKIWQWCYGKGQCHCQGSYIVLGAIE